jgi:hypothetical protein
VTPERTIATPGRPGRAYCQKCGHPAAATRWEPGVGEVFEPHNRYGTEMKCLIQPREPVVPPTVQR